MPGSQFLVLDLNNDGRPDIAELDNNGPHGNTVDIYQNHSNGSGSLLRRRAAEWRHPAGHLLPARRLRPRPTSASSPATSTRTASPTLGAAQTYNTGNSNPYSIDYAFNTSTGGAISFGALQSVGLGNAPTYVAAADFTGDGYRRPRRRQLQHPGLRQ